MFKKKIELKMTHSFKFAISASTITYLVENACDDNDNKNYKRLQGDYLKEFVKGITDYELRIDDSFKMLIKPTHGVVWTKPARKSTHFYV